MLAKQREAGVDIVAKPDLCPSRLVVAAGAVRSKKTLVLVIPPVAINALIGWCPLRHRLCMARLTLG